MTSTRARRGLSLVEMLVAMAISGIVLGGAVAAIGMGGQTFRAATSGLATSPAMDGMSRLSADLELAIAFTERTATATSFYVPDRTGDGAPDLLRYAWGGSAGDPLTLSMNGSTPAAVVPAATGVSFEYLVASMAGKTTWYAPPPPAPSDTKVFDRSYTGGSTFHTLSMTASLGAIIKPNVGDSAERFRVTRVRIPMQGVALGGDVTVSLHRVNMTSATPEPTALASGTVRQSDLPATAAQVEVTLNSTTEFAKGSFIAIVVSQKLGTSAARIPLENSPQYLTDGWIATTNLLGQWNINATKDMPLEVYAELLEGS